MAQWLSEIKVVFTLVIMKYKIKLRTLADQTHQFIWSDVQHPWPVEWIQRLGWNLKTKFQIPSLLGKATVDTPEQRRGGGVHGQQQKQRGTRLPDRGLLLEAELQDTKQVRGSGGTDSTEEGMQVRCAQWRRVQPWDRSRHRLRADNGVCSRHGSDMPEASHYFDMFWTGTKLTSVSCTDFKMGIDPVPVVTN